jgi:beta-galactosidase
MNRNLIFIAIIGIVSFSCTRHKDYSDIGFLEKDPADWENPAVNEINREMPRAWFIPFGSVVEAETDSRWASSLVQSLNG